jgi:hypothetical protein
MTTFVQEHQQQRKGHGQIQAVAELQSKFTKDFCPKTVTDRQIDNYLKLIQLIMPQLKMTVPGKDTQFRQSVRNLLNVPVKVRQNSGQSDRVVFSGLLRDLEQRIQDKTGRSLTCDQHDQLTQLFV